jgi:hypothetical protein
MPLRINREAANKPRCPAPGRPTLIHRWHHHAENRLACFRKPNKHRCLGVSRTSSFLFRYGSVTTRTHGRGSGTACRDRHTTQQMSRVRGSMANCFDKPRLIDPGSGGSVQ